KHCLKRSALEASPRATALGLYLGVAGGLVVSGLRYRRRIGRRERVLQGLVQLLVEILLAFLRGMAGAPVITLEVVGLRLAAAGHLILALEKVHQPWERLSRADRSHPPCWLLAGSAEASLPLAPS